MSHSIVQSAFLVAFVAQACVRGVLATPPAATYSVTYLPYDTPKMSEPGQSGTNQCGTESSQTSMCQNAYINSLDDFCLWAPPSNKSSYGDSSIANTEQLEVAWCLRSGYGTRVMPPGTIYGAHWIQTENYVQVTGYGNLTKLLIPEGDDGGELDPHGYDGNGNPIGGLVFGTSFGGEVRQYHEWTNFMGGTYFCFRACIDDSQNPGNKSPYGARQYCGHVWDTLGCGWNMPGNYADGFTSCLGDSTDPMGIYVDNGVTTTFSQGDPVTPSAHPAGRSSSCTTFPALTLAGSSAPPFTASLLPSSVSASLSKASVASVSAVRATSTSTTTTSAATSTVTPPPASSGTGSTTSGSSTPSPTQSSGASPLARIDFAVPRALFGGIIGIILGFGAAIMM